MSVHDDYRAGDYGRYFTTTFIGKHLMPKQAMGLDGHKAKREMSRAQNIALNQRNQRGRAVSLNSLIWDIDLSQPERVNQVFRLMQEVEARNAEGYYLDGANLQIIGNERGFLTEHAYHLGETEPGSRNKLVYRRFLYGVIVVDGSRHIINHFASIQA